ncbi:MAG: cobalamin biosynthesis protein [Treponema sp.]|nr:cobalamin biosynthesis protein [Spirochaetia bacterium]MDD7458435.1 cobalamin biosynthesis protein [Spirochaetales bacterium]MDY5812650.1 cobalamin biosynthesis protein [Treponema sp.]
MKVKNILLIRVVFFTEKAVALFNKLKSSLPEIEFISLNDKANLLPWTKESFEKSIPLIFISAAGIAVRTIAPFIKDKVTDSPVLVMDENGKFIIPVLSGHLGNANKIAELISKSTGVQCVITTATDINQKFSIDTFAKENNLKILNRDGIKKVSAKVLAGKQIKIYIDDSIKIGSDKFTEEIILTDKIENADVGITANEVNARYSNLLLNLVPKKYCIGMGCKKGKSFEELKTFAEKVFASELKLELRNNICSISTIDLKEKETGLLEFAHYLHIPEIFYTAEELNNAKGCFSESEFVKETTGVSNICERAAVLSAGDDSKLIIKKVSEKGMTISVAEKQFEGK